MSHSQVIIGERINYLKAATENETLQDKLETLSTKANAVNQIILESSSEEEERHDALHDTEKWVKKAEVTDNDFEEQLDNYIELLDQYD